LKFGGQMTTPDKFNAPGGLSINIPPIDLVDENGNITANTINAKSITAPVIFGDLVGNVIGSTTSEAVAHHGSTPPENPVNGQMWFDTTVSQFKIFTNVAGTQVWMPIFGGSKPNETARYEFDSSLRWLVQHGKSTIRFREYVMNIYGERVYAFTRIIDSNSFEILFTEATAGSVEVSFD
jgi:hypothetical protein